MADSSYAGFLAPLLPPVADDDALLDLLQPIVVGISGHPDPSLVRPGWQTPDTPNLPEYTQDWIALRISRTRPDTYRFEQHVADGEGYDYVEYSEEIDLMLSCYGPRSQGYARVLRDGFQIPQNRNALQAFKIDTLYVSEPLTLPALLTNVWVRRVDLTVTLRRVVEQSYGVKTILSAPGVTVNSAGNGLDNEHYITPINVEVQP